MRNTRKSLLTLGLIILLLGTVGLSAAVAATNLLVFVEAQFDNTNGVDGLAGAFWPAVSPDGKHVYVASFDDNAVAVFSRDPVSGALTFVEAQFDGVGGVDGINGAEGIAISPDGKHVYVAGAGDDAVAVFRRDSTSGALTFVEAKFEGVGGVDGLKKALFVTVSPDGKHVYVAGFDDNAVAVFSRDPTTGQLSFVEALENGGTDSQGNTIDGLIGPISIAVSPDGKHVYVDGPGDSAVTLFNRDATTGRLTWVKTLRDGDPDGHGHIIDGLDGSTSVTVSPDRTCVYVAGFFDDAVAVFKRNTVTGDLTFVEALKDGGTDSRGNLIDGLNGARAVAVGPVGFFLYVTGTEDNAITAFRRNATTCRLTYLETRKDGVGGVDGLNKARGAAVSPEGTHLYVASELDNAVAVFRTPPPPVRAVGGYGEPLSPLALLAPWLLLTVFTAAGAVGALMLRQRRV